MGCKQNHMADPKKDQSTQKSSMNIKNSKKSQKGRQFTLDEMSQTFITYENVSFDKFNLLYGTQKDLKLCPHYQINTPLLLKFIKFKAIQTNISFNYQISDISIKGKKYLLAANKIQCDVCEDLALDLTPKDLIQGNYYLIEIESEAPQMKINTILGPVILASQQLPQNNLNIKKNSINDWFSYLTTNELSLKNINLSIGQEMNEKPVQDNKFTFGGHYTIHFNNLSGIKNYKKQADDDQYYTEIGLTMFIIDKTLGKLIYTQMDIIPQGTELMLEDTEDLQLFINLNGDNFKTINSQFLWVCYGWDKKQPITENQFYSFIEFQIHDECKEIVKLIGFQEEENNQLKVELFGKTGWMFNQRYFVQIGSIMENIVKDNINQFITIKLKFEEKQQKKQENAIYFIKEADQIMTQWKIIEMEKFVN